MTLILILTIAGFTEITAIETTDSATCERWGQLSVEAGEATAYRCIAAA